MQHEETIKSPADFVYQTSLLEQMLKKTQLANKEPVLATLYEFDYIQNVSDIDWKKLVKNHQIIILLHTAGDDKISTIQ